MKNVTTHQRRYFNQKCSICGKHVIYLYEHKKNMHDDNGHKSKKTTKKKETSKPPQEKATKKKNERHLEQEIEDLKNENEVLRQHIQELYLIMTGRLPPNLTHISKIFGDSYDEKCREELLNELQEKLKEIKID